MPPPENGNLPISFVDLIAVDRLGPNTFKSNALAFGPANGNRTYGGHVYMQAAYAAAQTVAEGMVLHNITGWFLLAGKANERFIYTVRRIRDGGYSTRGVDVVQESDPNGMCFTCICSFKRPEKKASKEVNLLPQMDLRKTFAAALGSLRPGEHPEMPGVDAPWYWEFSRRNNGYTDPFPGLHLHRVDMDAYNANKPPLDKKNLKYYSVRHPETMPSVHSDPNLHLCAHLYASDRNSLFVISNHLGVGNDYSQIASLSHTVIFHTDHCAPEEFSMLDPSTGQARWFVQEAWTGGARHGRGLHETRIWKDEDGFQIASSIQDGMMRLKQDDGEGKAGFSPEGMIRQLEKDMQQKHTGGNSKL